MRREEGDGEFVRYRSSSESSHPYSHISLSSVDSNEEAMICATPSILLSPQDKREEDSLSSTSDLFHMSSRSPYAAVESVYRNSGDKRDCDRVDDHSMKGESLRTVESILVESSGSSKVSSAASTPPESPHTNQKQNASTSDRSVPEVSIPNVSIPDIIIPEISIADITIPEISISDGTNPEISIPDVTIPEISIPDITIPEISIPNIASPDVSIPNVSTPDYSPVDNYSFGAFNDNINSCQSASSRSERASVAAAPLKLVTPVNVKTITAVPKSVDTVRRKSQNFKTPANSGVELQTDNDITPTPDFKSMRTPCLKGECARFGVKPLPKKKMIAKLHEIYEYTHPLVGKGIRSADNYHTFMAVFIVLLCFAQQTQKEG